MKRGKLIVLDGPDYTGKKTQTSMLINRLNKECFPVKHIRFPMYETPTGRIVGQAYLGKKRDGYIGDVAWFGDADKVDSRIASHYYAADRLAAKPQMLEALASGINIVSDRYYHANMGHQGGKIKDRGERQKLFQYIIDLELKLNQIPQEDLLLILTLTPELAIERATIREENADGHENLEHIKNAAEAYEHLYQFYQYKDNWKLIACDKPDSTTKFRIISKTEEELHEEIYQHVIEILD